MVCSLEQNDADLAAAFSKWHTGATEHRMHCESACTKISANSGVDQGCPLSTCGFSAAIADFGQYKQIFADIMTRAPSSLPTWMTCICGSNLSACCQYLLSSQLQPDQSISSFSPPKYRFGGPLARTQPPELQDKVRLTLSCLGRHLQIHGNIEPSPVVLGEQASMENPTQRFQRNCHYICRPQRRRTQCSVSE